MPAPNDFVHECRRLLGASPSAGTDFPFILINRRRGESMSSRLRITE